jgi:hypothetical protein
MKVVQWWRWLVQWRRWWLGTAVVLMLVQVYAFWPDPKAQRPSSAFYQAAAQIIPVLVVAFVLEQSYRWRDLRSPGPPLVTFAHPGPPLVISALFVGEIAAMSAVAFGERESKKGHYIVRSPLLTDEFALLSALALVTGFIGVLVLAVVAARAKARR